MSLVSPRAGRFGARLTAGTAAGLVASAALAAPAWAEIPGIDDPAAHLSLAPTVTAGATAPGSIGVEYTHAGGQEDATHAVVAELAFDGSVGVLELASADEACEVAPNRIVCSADAGPSSAFAFDLTAAASAEDERFGYDFTVTIDGHEVANTTGTLDVESTYDVHNPYAHGSVAATGVEAGATAEVNPVFHQEFALAPTAAAVVVAFSDPLPKYGLDPTGLAEVVADYDNCVDDPDLRDAAVACVITEFEDAPGQAFTLSDPVAYAIGADVAGPFDVCSCKYTVSTVNAATLESDFGGVFWDESSANLLGLAPADGWDGSEDSIAFYWGPVDLTTADNPYDLIVEDIELEGKVGDTTTVTTTIANRGSAAADDLFPASDSYQLRMQLPEGVELVAIDSDGTGSWECADEDALESIYESAAWTNLEWFDLVCTADRFDAATTVDFAFTVKLTDTSAYQGAIEIGGIYHIADELERDLSSDFALIANLATEVRYDYDQDGYEDLLVIRKSDGVLRFYAGTGDGTYATAVTVGPGWGKMDIVMAGDLTGDGVPDFIARDNRTGILYTYPGDGEGGHGTRIALGPGWGKMGQISVGNYDGDGHPDLLATAHSTGTMYYYQGLGDGTFAARELTGEQWQGWDVITSLGDLDGDGFDEFLSRWNYDGRYYVYTSTGDVHEVDQSMYDWVYTRRYDQVVGVGDLSGDGKPDIASTDLETGQLVLRYFDPEQPTTVTGRVIGNSGWNGVRLPVTLLDRTYDYDYDGYSDFVAQRESSGDLFLYWGTGTGHGDRWNMCDDCDGITMTAAGGDYNSDGRTDLVYRAYTGELFVAPGLDTGEIGFTSEIRVGPGWNSMDNITGGQDFNSDGRDDLIARKKSTGILYLYPGRGDGTFGSRIEIGPGWNSMREVTSAGDLDHDGHADMLTVKKSDNCLYFYAGRGNGTFKSRVEIGCGWTRYDQVTGVGDFNRDGHADWLARRNSDGALYLYRGNGAGSYSTRVQIGTSWNSMSSLG
ncbi:VCBS repeat-containing protein [Glycomyces sp. A-F 0318]|uniref:FG-GAP repeat domain-containing protein n=1 Tax=Glycomyces amatae TaxID=2881355 RepID=UPI001E330549|nr:VCBS repeat-containing protein [Glycomyces amatae]MCD0443611.1 VCBS repeat-containing protein [Glycomyces amatae]